MATPPPSVYCYRSERDWEIDMAIWCEENELRTRYYAVVSDQPKYSILARSPANQQTKWFDTPEERSAWLAKHPELNLVEYGEELVNWQYGVRPSFLPPTASDIAGCPDHLPGGSASDYRMAGYSRY